METQLLAFHFSFPGGKGLEIPAPCRLTEIPLQGGYLVREKRRNKKSSEAGISGKSEIAGLKAWECYWPLGPQAMPKALVSITHFPRTERSDTLETRTPHLTGRLTPALSKHPGANRSGAGAEPGPGPGQRDFRGRHPPAPQYSPSPANTLVSVHCLFYRIIKFFIKKNYT